MVLKKKILSISFSISLCALQSLQATQEPSLFQSIGIMARTASATAIESIKNNPKTALAFFVAALAGTQLYGMYKNISAHGPLGWQLDQKEIKELIFPADFLWGVGSSAHQFEGNCTNNNWHRWEQEQIAKQSGLVKEPSGQACDHWNRYKEDIQLIKELGANSFRFSIEWSKVQPREDQFDETALQHYNDVCDELIKNNIKPCVTLHHYTDPLWFADKGGFAQKENIHYFVEFCKKVYDRLHTKVHLWFTFNSPDGYAAKGYLKGFTPPGEQNMQRMSEVYKNLLEAHVQTYRALKNRIVGHNPKIGILKNIFQLDPARVWNPLDIIGCTIGRSLQDDCFFDFFTQGTFKIYVPFKASVKHVNREAIGAIDFIGINYYSHGIMNNFSVGTHPKEEETQTKIYTIYPEGLYRAISLVHHRLIKKLPNTIPIYITENGIATDDAATRTKFCKYYLYALSKAIQEGYDVRGYIRWALLDNYEWGTTDKHYGEYHVDFKTQKRTLKEGSKFFQRLLHAYHQQNLTRSNNEITIAISA